MRGRGTEVVLVHDLLTETLEHKPAREWLLSRRLRPEDVTVMFAEPLRTTARLRHARSHCRTTGSVSHLRRRTPHRPTSMRDPFESRDAHRFIL
jgi:arginine deiminase